MITSRQARFVASHEVGEVEGAVVVIDVIRAFTTAAHAFDAGATCIYLVDSVADALAFKAAQPGSMAMGEDHGLRPEGFDLPNSPVAAAQADLDGRVVVQRTSAPRKACASTGSTPHEDSTELVSSAPALLLDPRIDHQMADHGSRS